MTPRKALLALGLGVAVAGGCSGEEVSPDAVPVRLMTYNIGNPNADDAFYPLRLKDQDYEDFMAQRIRGIGPDIALFQEVLPPTHCATFDETDPALTCYDAANREPPIRRILGPDYTIVCDARMHVECIGVRTDFGTIDGVAAGAFVLDGADTPPLPMDECVWADGTCSDAYCDAESTVSAIDVTTEYGALRVVHLHPNAAGKSASGDVYTGAPCRALQLQQVFEGVPGAGDAALVTDATTIAAGDFNMDPVRLASADEEALWQRHVGPGNRFADLDPVDERGIQHATRREGLGLAIDHVLVDRAAGTCTVHGDDYIGSDPGTLPLDEEFDWSGKPGGEFYASRIDHFAITCELELDLTE